jgi:histidyl-tRNA synthetase
VAAQYDLPKYFKRYQIQPVWRADRPARGRFREFYQCDVDALGSTSPAIEAELCAAVSDALVELGFTDFVIRLNHRQLLASILSACGVPPELHGTALVAVDKLDKIGPDGVAAELRERGVTEGADAAVLRAFKAVETPDGELARLEAFVGGDAAGASAIDNLRQIVALAAGTKADGRIRVDPSLARGLSYYTGAIMEIAVADLAGSLGGGGRYDNLVGMFLGQEVPACGFSLGLERILVVMGERNMFPPALARAAADVMVSCFTAAGLPTAMKLASELRAAGLRVMVYPDADKIGKQIKYADSRGIPCVALLGDDEIAQGTVTIKDLARQTHATHSHAEAGAAIRKALSDRG